MIVSEAIMNRISIRAFLDKPVPKETIVKILETAKYAPSGGNLQPWKVYVVAGAARDELIRRVEEKRKTHKRGEGFEYHVYPPDLKEPYDSRRFKCGEDMYGTMGIKREDKKARVAHFIRNYQFFDAPVGLIFTIDRQMEWGQWADLGMFIQNVMLLAKEHGLDTCAQESWAGWHQTLTGFLDIPDHDMVFCGMALGYVNPDAPVNSLRTERAALDEFATLVGFEAE